MRWRVGGVPVVSIVGALALVALIIMAWAFLADPSAGLKGHPVLIWMNIGIFVSGFVIFYIAKAVQKSRGIDISKSFAQLPVE